MDSHGLWPLSLAPPRDGTSQRSAGASDSGGSSSTTTTTGSAAAASSQLPSTVEMIRSAERTLVSMLHGGVPPARGPAGADGGGAARGLGPSQHQGGHLSHAQAHTHTHLPQRGGPTPPATAPGASIPPRHGGVAPARDVSVSAPRQQRTPASSAPPTPGHSSSAVPVSDTGTTQMRLDLKTAAAKADMLAAELDKAQAHANEEARRRKRSEAELQRLQQVVLKRDDQVLSANDHIEALRGELTHLKQQLAGVPDGKREQDALRQQTQGALEEMERLKAREARYVEASRTLQDELAEATQKAATLARENNKLRVAASEEVGAAAAKMEAVTKERDQLAAQVTALSDVVQTLEAQRAEGLVCLQEIGREAAKMEQQASEEILSLQRQLQQARAPAATRSPIARPQDAAAARQASHEIMALQSELYQVHAKLTAANEALKAGGERDSNTTTTTTQRDNESPHRPHHADTHVFQRKMEDLARTEGVPREKARDAQLESEALSFEVEALKEKLYEATAAAERVPALQEECDALQQQLCDARACVERLEAEVHRLRDGDAHCSERVRGAEERVESERVRVAELTAANEALQRTAYDANKAHEAASIDVEHMRGDLVELKERMECEAAVADDLRHDVDMLSTELINARTRIEDLARINDTLVQELHEAREVASFATDQSRDEAEGLRGALRDAEARMGYLEDVCSSSAGPDEVREWRAALESAEEKVTALEQENISLRKEAANATAAAAAAAAPSTPQASPSVIGAPAAAPAAELSAVQGQVADLKAITRNLLSRPSPQKAALDAATSQVRHLAAMVKTQQTELAQYKAVLASQGHGHARGHGAVAGDANASATFSPTSRGFERDLIAHADTPHTAHGRLG